MEIRHSNIIYISDISEIGGVETYVFQMIKKYKDLDIAVVYKQANIMQLYRLQKLCPTYCHTNQKIICKVAIINYDTSIINYITEDIWKENAKEDEGIYQGIHADYENPVYKWKPPTDDRIKAYIAITKYIAESFKRITGLTNIIQIYNPLEVEINNKKPIILVSATRLSEIKGKDRMIRLAKELDDAGIYYIWYVFTNDTEVIESPNVVYMKSRLNIDYWLDQADYLVQLSDTEGLSYSINEMLYRNKPVIVTPLPYLDEIGVKDGINAYILEFDCSNIDYIVKNIQNAPKFNFKKLEDTYNEILYKSKSNYNYEEMKNMRYLVEATDKYMKLKIADTELSNIKGGDYIPQPGEIFEVDAIRMRVLCDNGYATVIGEVDEELVTNINQLEEIDHKIEQPEAEFVEDVEEITVDETISEEEYRKELKKLKKSDLVIRANELDIGVTDRHTKDTIIDLIISKLYTE